MAKKQVQQSAWSDVDIEPLKPVPPIEVKAMPVLPTDSKVSTGARRIIKPARDAGWGTLITYARGPYIGASGQFLRMSDSILVRGMRAGELFAACWIDGSYEFGYIGPAEGPPTRVNATELRARIA